MKAAMKLATLVVATLPFAAAAAAAAAAPSQGAGAVGAQTTGPKSAGPQSPNAAQNKLASNTTPQRGPSQTGQPNETCGSATAPSTPGKAASAPGSAFNPNGTAGTKYAGERLAIRRGLRAPAEVAATAQRKARDPAGFFSPRAQRLLALVSPFILGVAVPWSL